MNLPVYLTKTSVICSHKYRVICCKVMMIDGMWNIYYNLSKKLLEKVLLTYIMHVLILVMVGRGKTAFAHEHLFLA